MNSLPVQGPHSEPDRARGYRGRGQEPCLVGLAGAVESRRWPRGQSGRNCSAGCSRTGPQPFAAIDLERRIIWSNRAFWELVGFGREELLGMSILDLTAPQSLEVTRRSQDDILATGKIERVVKNYRRKDGSLVPVELVMDVLRDDSGQPMGLYAFITDISERVRAEEAVAVEVGRVGTPRQGAVRRDRRRGLRARSRRDGSSTPIRRPAGSSATRAKSCWR